MSFSFAPLLLVVKSDLLVLTSCCVTNPSMNCRLLNGNCLGFERGPVLCHSLPSFFMVGSNEKSWAGAKLPMLISYSILRKGIPLFTPSGEAVDALRLNRQRFRRVLNTTWKQSQQIAPDPSSPLLSPPLLPYSEAGKQSVPSHSRSIHLLGQTPSGKPIRSRNALGRC